VREYLFRRARGGAELVTVDRSLYPTLGPENRFATVIYLEKEGFEPLLLKARVLERFDCAIMSSKGMPVVAARMIAEVYGQQRVRILMAHDFDRAGACIARTLGNDTRRYTFDVAPEIIDIGLNLDDARAMGLQDEEAPDAGPKADKLREYGLAEEEVEFLAYDQRRYELNAMDSDAFLAWIEGKLAAHGAGKVVPEAAVLERHARRVLARQLVAARVRPLIDEVEAEVARVELPRDLPARVRQEMARDRALSWDDAIELVTADVTPGAA
jgi:hypothetical protein